MANGVGAFLLRRSSYSVLAVVVLVIVGLTAWSRVRRSKQQVIPAQSSAARPVDQDPSSLDEDRSSTMMFAHNLELRKGAEFSRVCAMGTRAHAAD